MITEIYHKNVDIGSEDQLTGNVFGALRYLPFAIFRSIFINSANPTLVCQSLDDYLPKVVQGEWGRNVLFWNHYSSSKTEPDVVIEFEKSVILIEVKYNSMLSGENQLKREAELLRLNYPNKKKFLILLAPEDSAITIFKDQKAEISSDISFGYITWQALLSSITIFKNDSLVLEDLEKLLILKGFGGFRSFRMMDKDVVKAFQTVKETHNNVQDFISRCISLAESKSEFELAPMTGNNTFLRWSSDRDSNAWSYGSIILAFQQCSVSRLKDVKSDESFYVLELNFVDFDIPMANIARYDYDLKNSHHILSPADHWVFYQPMYDGILEFSDYKAGEMYCGESTIPLERYWGLRRVLGYEVPLSEINADNIVEKVFGTFNELANK